MLNCGSSATSQCRAAAHRIAQACLALGRQLNSSPAPTLTPSFKDRHEPIFWRVAHLRTNTNIEYTGKTRAKQRSNCWLSTMAGPAGRLLLDSRTFISVHSSRTASLLSLWWSRPLQQEWLPAQCMLPVRIYVFYQQQCFRLDASSSWRFSRRSHGTLAVARNDIAVPRNVLPSLWNACASNAY